MISSSELSLKLFENNPDLRSFNKSEVRGIERQKVPAKHYYFGVMTIYSELSQPVELMTRNQPTGQHFYSYYKALQTLPLHS